jgi:hypothetical protein
MRNAAAVGVLGIVIGCSGEWNPPDISASQSFGIPETVSVRGQDLILTTSLLRMMRSDQPVYGQCIVRAIDSTDLPASLTIDGIWIVNGQEVWKGWVGRDPRIEELFQYGIVRIIKDGPMWGPFARVDVIVRLRFEDSTILLRAVNQYIAGVGIVPFG